MAGGTPTCWFWGPYLNCLASNCDLTLTARQWLILAVNGAKAAPSLQHAADETAGKAMHAPTPRGRISGGAAARITLGRIKKLGP
jgi:hypothetical protein